MGGHLALAPGVGGPVDDMGLRITLARHAKRGGTAAVHIKGIAGIEVLPEEPPRARREG